MLRECLIRCVDGDPQLASQTSCCLPHYSICAWHMLVAGDTSVTGSCLMELILYWEAQTPNKSSYSVKMVGHAFSGRWQLGLGRKGKCASVPTSRTVSSGGWACRKWGWHGATEHLSSLPKTHSPHVPSQMHCLPQTFPRDLPLSPPSVSHPSLPWVFIPDHCLFLAPTVFQASAGIHSHPYPLNPGKWM